MSNTSKTVIWIIVILVVLTGVWMLMAKPADNYTAAPAVTTQAPTPDQGAAMTGPTPVANSSVSNPTDTSDSSINNDSASIDSQMSGLNSDSSATTPASDNQ